MTIIELIYDLCECNLYTRLTLISTFWANNAYSRCSNNVCLLIPACLLGTRFSVINSQCHNNSAISRIYFLPPQNRNLRKVVHLHITWLPFHRSQLGTFTPAFCDGSHPRERRWEVHKAMDSFHSFATSFHNIG